MANFLEANGTCALSAYAKKFHDNRNDRCVKQSFGQAGTCGDCRNYRQYQKDVAKVEAYRLILAEEAKKKLGG